MDFSYFFSLYYLGIVNTESGGYSMTYSYLLMKSGIEGLFIDPVRSVGNEVSEKVNEFYWNY